MKLSPPALAQLLVVTQTPIDSVRDALGDDI